MIGRLPHQRRVVDEASELADKAAALGRFLDSQAGASLDPDERERMKRKHWIMGAYYGVLRERIAAFTITP